MDTPVYQRGVRPSLKYLVRLWVIGIGFLILVAPTDIPIVNRLISCAILLLFFWTAFWPVQRNERQQIVSASPAASIPLKRKIALVFLQFVFIDVAARFYTGSGLVDGILGLFQGANTYQSYQNYFTESQISSQPIYTRLHIIMFLAIGKFTFVAITCDFYVRLDRHSFSGFAIFFVSTLTYIAFGLCRGTFFEVFEVVIANVYFSMISRSLRPNTGTKTTASIFKMVLLLILPILFIFNAMRRYDDPAQFLQHVCSSNFCFDSYNIWFYGEYLLYIMATYFSNGIYSISVFYENILAGIGVEYIIPLYSIFLYDTEAIGVRGLICETYLNCRFVWVPDLTLFMSLFGIAAFFAVAFLLRIFHRLEVRMMKKGRLSGYIFLFYITVLVISLPVGNFITVSSANILGLAIAAFASHTSMRLRYRKLV